MTGYANASASPVAPSAATLHEPADSSPAIGVEMRSVNNRFLDLSLKLPDEFRSLEPALRELVTARFKRGKIELRVSSGADSGPAVAEPDEAQLAHVAHLGRRVRQAIPEAREL